MRLAQVGLTEMMVFGAEPGAGTRRATGYGLTCASRASGNCREDFVRCLGLSHRRAEEPLQEIAKILSF